MNTSVLRHRNRALIAATAVMLCAGMVHGQARLMEIANLPGATECRVRGMSADGRVAIGDSGIVVACCHHAFRWTRANGTVDLGEISNVPVEIPDYSPTGVSADGAVIVGVLQGVLSMQQRAFRWTLAGGIEDLNINLTPDDNAVARAVTADGTVIVGSSTLGGGFRWVNGEVTHPWPHEPAAISGDGQVVFKLRWIGGVIHTIRMSEIGEQDIGGFVARGSGYLGDAVVGYSEDAFPLGAIRWTAAGGLEALAGSSRYAGAAAVDADGSVVVGGLGMLGGACFWSGTMPAVNLNEYLLAHGADLAGWELDFANGVSADGNVIVGGGTHYGQQAGWVAWLRPVCGTADFNHDGDVGTDQDIEAFFRCLTGDCCPNCDSTDVNGDGDVGTDQDIEAFFRVLAGGTC